VRPQHARLGPAYRQAGGLTQDRRQRRELFEDARRIGPSALEVRRPGAAPELLLDPRPEGEAGTGQHEKHQKQFCDAGHFLNSTFGVLLAYREEQVYAPLSVTVWSKCKVQSEKCKVRRYVETSES
jgi:hypothetical protein